MAQLRDAQTSELVGEGTPLELALLADELGRDEVIFDDVGEEFDPDAVLEAARAKVEGLVGAADAAKGAEAKALRAAHADAEAELELDRELVERAGSELEAARAKANV